VWYRGVYKNTSDERRPMKTKKDSPGAKVMPVKKPEKAMSFEEHVKEFTGYHKNPDELSKIFTELGFRYVKDGCSGNCVPCKKKAHCATYREIKGCFNTTSDKGTTGEDL
jgi:hypothetical protein